MSIKTQKVLRFIPIVNLITAFMWLYAIHKNNVPKLEMFKWAFKMVGLILIVVIPNILVDKLCPINMIVTICNLVFIYLYLFAISFIAVAHQQVIESEK